MYRHACSSASLHRSAFTPQTVTPPPLRTPSHTRHQSAADTDGSQLISLIRRAVAHAATGDDGDASYHVLRVAARTLKLNQKTRAITFYSCMTTPCGFYRLLLLAGYAAKQASNALVRSSRCPESQRRPSQEGRLLRVTCLKTGTCISTRWRRHRQCRVCADAAAAACAAAEFRLAAGPMLDWCGGDAAKSCPPPACIRRGAVPSKGFVSCCLCLSDNVMLRIS